MTDPEAEGADDVIDWLRSAYRANDRGQEVDGRLHSRLEDRAERAGILDIAYRTVDSPIGSLLLATTPAGLLRVAFVREGHDAVLADLATTVSPRVLRAPRRLDGVASQLEEYFAGRRRHFTVPVDLQLAHGFRRDVLVQLRAIPYGATESYARVATSAGRPTAVRAAASACSHNPVPVVIPCHRVVRSDGTPGEYRGGADAKRRLLAIEAAA